MAEKENDAPAVSPGIAAGVKLKLTYFTDPLCCWSWGFQPQLHRLLQLYTSQMSVRYVMGGMLPSWNRFHDEINAVTRPAQMGPVWMHAAQLTGRPIDYTVWIRNPPQSSYPACIAVKAAALQSDTLGMAYFEKVQEAVMQHAQDISSWPVLNAIAMDIHRVDSSFDVKQFTDEYQQGGATAEFRKDLELTARYSVTRFPTLVIESGEMKSIIISGYRTHETVCAAIEKAFGVVA